MAEIHIFRHGQTEWNLEGRMQGAMDSCLTELGKTQAIEARSKIVDVEFNAAYSSSSSRATDTAQLLLDERGVSLTPLDAFKEINLGVWEGELHEDIIAQYAEQNDVFWQEPSKFSLEGAETFEQLRIRATEALTDLAHKHQGETILLVSHAALIKTLLTSLEGRAMDELWGGPYAKNLSHSIVYFDGHQFTVKQFCDEPRVKLEEELTEEM